ncbi:MAG TPA: MBL fold metallo-hydrolase [Acidimicrobiales bacterium]|nr:MBL fold metallo-hydrolase [Acidimicrobiales bacterium]
MSSATIARVYAPQRRRECGVRVRVRTISADELLARLDHDDDVCVLDVREPDEYDAWRIPGAVNVPLGALGSRLEEVPAGTEIVTVCAVGARATTASELLDAAGRDSEVLEGGMAAWSRVFDDVEVRVGGATILQVRRRGKGCLSYVVAAGGGAVVIDPAADVDRYLTRAAARGWAITHVLDTHLHADHVSGARALAAAAGAALVLNPADRFGFPHAALEDGMTVGIGDGVALTVSVLATPGHTSGSTTFLLGSAAIFTGDTLFLESVGRPDLADQAEAFAHVLYRSLHDKVLRLPDTALVLPAHVGSVVEVRGGEVVAATLGALRSRLWQLTADEDDFVRWAVGSVTARPPNYATIVATNKAGRDVDDEERTALEAGPNRCAIAS